VGDNKKKERREKEKEYRGMPGKTGYLRFK
jgi:hypothetical protein